MPSIEVSYQDRRLTLDPGVLERLRCAVERGEGHALDVHVQVVDDREIHRLNREFLGHDWETDVITFDLSDGPGPISGEVVVSAEYAEHEAAEHGHPALAELYFYVCHGLLHLLGYDDADPTDRERMLARQREYLQAVGVAVNS